jgi:phosphosulfolactate synthase
MWDSPSFLDLPDRATKPRSSGLTHVLDKGMSIPALEAQLSQTGHLVDVIKIGWGVAYIDPNLKQRVGLCQSAGVLTSLGGTLLEIAESQGRVGQLVEWAEENGIAAVEVSDGLQALSPGRKTELVGRLAKRFVVLAETGAKDGRVPVVPSHWVDEMAADLDAGARWVVVEGRESGTVGLYHHDGTLRTELVDAIGRRLPLDKVIFEAPHKAQQAWLIHHFGSDVNLGNIPSDEVIPVETLRLGLRADTAAVRQAVASR